jgi:hypothetical protein
VPRVELSTLPRCLESRQWARSGQKNSANQRVVAVCLPKRCQRREAPVAQDDGNERDAAHVTSTATVPLLRTLCPNSVVRDTTFANGVFYQRTPSFPHCIFNPWVNPAQPPGSSVDRAKITLWMVDGGLAASSPNRPPWKEPSPMLCQGANSTRFGEQTSHVR